MDNISPDTSLRLMVPRPDRDGWLVGRNLASLEDQENLSGTIKLNWDIGFADLEWFVNKSTFENQQVFDSDYSDAGDIYNSDFNGWRSKRDTWSSELRLLSNNTGRFDWMAGVYWLDMESNWDWLETIHGEFFKPEWDTNGRYKTDNTSVFASAGYNFNDSWRLSGGLRWYDDSKTLRNGSQDSWSGVLWNAALELQYQREHALVLQCFNRLPPRVASMKHPGYHGCSAQLRFRKRNRL